MQSYRAPGDLKELPNACEVPIEGQTKPRNSPPDALPPELPRSPPPRARFSPSPAGGRGGRGVRVETAQTQAQQRLTSPRPGTQSQATRYGLSRFSVPTRLTCLTCLTCLTAPARGSFLPLARWRESDRLRERQGSRFENLKVFEFVTGLLGGSAPKPPGFF